MAQYSAKLGGNILISGQTDSGKTTTLQKWILNGYFNKNITTIYWISGIPIEVHRLKELEECFKNFEFKCTEVADKDALVNVINNLKQLAESKDNVQDNSDSDSGNEGDNENTDHNENQADMSVLGLTTAVKQSKTTKSKTKPVLGEHVPTKYLVVFDDMTEVADRCKEFANFLTVSRKFAYTCIYLFHGLKTSWGTMLGQTHIFVFFKRGFTSQADINILRDLAVQNDKDAICTNRKNWVYQVFMDQVQKGPFESHLLIDTRRLNEDIPPAQYRGQSGNPTNQICYYVNKHNDNDYSTYISKHIKDDIFKIDSLVGQTKFGDRFALRAKSHLKRIDRNKRKVEILNSRSTDSSDSEDNYHDSGSTRSALPHRHVRTPSRGVRQDSGRRTTPAWYRGKHQQ